MPELKKLSKVLIFTSKDHIYANLILRRLIQKQVLNGSEVFILEQSSLIPNKSFKRGLLKYIKISGARYVVLQASKQYLFKFIRFLNFLLGNKNSSYYPYYHNLSSNFHKIELNNIKEDKSLAFIKRINPDLIISLYSKEIIPEDILSIPKYGSINLHPGLLPYYRGVSPTFWSMAHGEKQAGITLHYIDSGIDTGKIISRRILISNFQTEHSLYLKLSENGERMIGDFIRSLRSGNKIKTLSVKGKGSYYSLPTKEAAREFFSKGYKFFRVKEFFH
jgi:folate-dependent phosphoribosylglycinamide formyltransferase PurN